MRRQQRLARETKQRKRLRMNWAINELVSAFMTCADVMVRNIIE